MQLALSTAFAHAGGIGPDRVIDVLLRVGVDGVALDARLGASLLDELATRLRARRDELPVFSVESGCPAPDRGRRGRAPELAATDASEARAAIEEAERAIRLAGDLGAASDGTVFVEIALGEVEALRWRWPSVRRAFLRGELDQDEALREQLRDERAAHAARHYDPARRSLDRLSRIAAETGVRLGLRNPARYFGLPSPVELRFLLEDLAGAPIAPAFDAPAAHLAEAMGLVPFDDTLAAWKHAPLARLADACGPVGGLPPGRGEVDLGSLIPQLDACMRAVFAPWPGLTLDEVLDGTRAVRVLVPATGS